VRKVPLERIFIETDSPYLTPVPHRGRRNEPAYVRYVAETVARVRNTSLEQTASVTTANARALFRLP
jgi:TatD DNase family protein